MQLDPQPARRLSEVACIAKTMVVNLIKQATASLAAPALTDATDSCNACSDQPVANYSQFSTLSILTGAYLEARVTRSAKTTYYSRKLPMQAARCPLEQYLHHSQVLFCEESCVCVPTCCWPP